MAIRPKLRPKDEEFSKIVAAANSGGGGSDKPAAKGGKGGGKSVNPLAKEGSADYKKMQKANAPDSFYGYYDQNTGDYVPWYIDMINGGGANAAGPTFEGGFGTARLAGGLLNAAGVSPYGQDRPRAFMPMEAYRGGDDKPAPFDYRSGASAAPAPTGGGVIDAASGQRDSSPRPMLRPPLRQPATGVTVPSPSGPTGTADMPPGLLPMTLMTPTPDMSVPELRQPAGTPFPAPEYSGRGMVGMPYPSFAQTDEQRRTIDYLRSVGMLDY